MGRPRGLKRASFVAAVAAAWVLGGGTAALAHPQVAPTVVAPNDAVKFTLLVPGERQARTTEVELQLPPDLLPFAWEDPPGWKRRIVPSDDPTSLGNVIWTGRLKPDGFVEFAFLAGTPLEPGELSWKAIQTYDDGTVVRWIGPPGSEEPASVTLVDESAPRQNAGGESAGGGGEPTTTGGTETTETTETEPTETTEPTTGATETTADHGEEAAPASSGGDSSGDDWVARFLALIGIASAFAAIAFVLLRPKGDKEEPKT
jgi:uncharacterized protein YcnI